MAKNKTTAAAPGGGGVSLDIPGIDVARMPRGDVHRLSRALPVQDLRAQLQVVIGGTVFMGETDEARARVEADVKAVGEACALARAAAARAIRLAGGLGLGDAAARDVLAACGCDLHEAKLRVTPDVNDDGE